MWNKYYTQVSSLSCVSLFTGALGRARPFPLAQKMPSLAYQMIEIYVFFPPCFTVYVRKDVKTRKLGPRDLEGASFSGVVTIIYPVWLRQALA